MVDDVERLKSFLVGHSCIMAFTHLGEHVDSPVIPLSAVSSLVSPKTLPKFLLRIHLRRRDTELKCEMCWTLDGSPLRHEFEFGKIDPLQVNVRAVLQHVNYQRESYIEDKLYTITQSLQPADDSVVCI